MAMASRCIKSNKTRGRTRITRRNSWQQWSASNRHHIHRFISVCTSQGSLTRCIFIHCFNEEREAELISRTKGGMKFNDTVVSRAHKDRETSIVSSQTGGNKRSSGVNIQQAHPRGNLIYVMGHFSIWKVIATSKSSLRGSNVYIRYLCAISASHTHTQITNSE